MPSRLRSCCSFQRPHRLLPACSSLCPWLHAAPGYTLPLAPELLPRHRLRTRAQARLPQLPPPGPLSPSPRTLPPPGVRCSLRPARPGLGGLLAPQVPLAPPGPSFPQGPAVAGTRAPGGECHVPCGAPQLFTAAAGSAGAARMAEPRAGAQWSMPDTLLYSPPTCARGWSPATPPLDGTHTASRYQNITTVSVHDRKRHVSRAHLCTLPVTSRTSTRCPSTGSCDSESLTISPKNVHVRLGSSMPGEREGEGVGGSMMKCQTRLQARMPACG